MKTRPMAFTTSAPFVIVQPRPGFPGGRLSGRTQKSKPSISLRKMRWSHTWLPFVTTSAPASRSSAAISPVSPLPPAAFSPFTIARSIPRSARIAGTSAATACRPGLPTTSPTKRTLTSAGQRVDLIDGRVVCRDVRADLRSQAVVLSDEVLIGRVHVRRKHARRVLRRDRLDAAVDDRELRLPGIDGGTLRREPCVQGVLLHDAGIRRRRGDLGETHRPELALREPVRAALESGADETGDRMRHETEAGDTLQERVGGLLEPM